MRVDVKCRTYYVPKRYMYGIRTNCDYCFVIRPFVSALANGVNDHVLSSCLTRCSLRYRRARHSEVAARAAQRARAKPCAVSIPLSSPAGLHWEQQHEANEKGTSCTNYNSYFALRTKNVNSNWPIIWHNLNMQFVSFNVFTCIWPTTCDRLEFPTKF